MDFFDFDGDGKVSFEEQMLGTMLVMGVFDAPTENADDGSEEDVDE